MKRTNLFFISWKICLRYQNYPRKFTSTGKCSYQITTFDQSIPNDQSEQRFILSLANDIQREKKQIAWSAGGRERLSRVCFAFDWLKGGRDFSGQRRAKAMIADYFRHQMKTVLFTSVTQCRKCDLYVGWKLPGSAWTVMVRRKAKQKKSWIIFDTQLKMSLIKYSA